MAQIINHLAQAFAVNSGYFCGQDFHAFDVANVVQKARRLGAGGLAFQGFQLLFELFGGLDLALDGVGEGVFSGVE